MKQLRLVAGQNHRRARIGRDLRNVAILARVGQRLAAEFVSSLAGQFAQRPAGQVAVRIGDDCGVARHQVAGRRERRFDQGAAVGPRGPLTAVFQTLSHQHHPNCSPEISFRPGLYTTALHLTGPHTRQAWPPVFARARCGNNPAESWRCRATRRKNALPQDRSRAPAVPRFSGSRHGLDPGLDRHGISQFVNIEMHKRRAR